LRLPTPSKFWPKAGIVLVVTVGARCTSAVPVLVLLGVVAAFGLTVCGTFPSTPALMRPLALAWVLNGFMVLSRGDASCRTAVRTTGLSGFAAADVLRACAPAVATGWAVDATAGPADITRPTMLANAASEAAQPSLRRRRCRLVKPADGDLTVMGRGPP